MRLTIPYSLSVSVLLVAVLLIGGCAEPMFGPSDVKIQGLTPEQLGTLGARLKQNPRNQSTLFDEYDITLSQFEQAIRTISNDPKLSRRYRQAFEDQLNQ